jgi:two-component system, OmpR family, response regulator ArlR
VNVLIIEDEIEIAAAISEFLINEKNNVSVAQDIKEARKKIYEQEWDCVIFDIGLPSGDGTELIQEVKNLHPSCINLILSARNSNDDKIKGLDFGADDYMTKPFSLAELNARIKAIQRRITPHKNELVYLDISLNEKEFKVYCNAIPIELTRFEFAIISILLSNPEKVIRKSSIIEAIWKNEADSISSEEILYNHIKNVRKKLELAQSIVSIKTVYGIGYKLN